MLSDEILKQEICVGCDTQKKLCPPFNSSFFFNVSLWEKGFFSACASRLVINRLATMSDLLQMAHFMETCLSLLALNVGRAGCDPQRNDFAGL